MPCCSRTGRCDSPAWRGEDRPGPALTARSCPGWCAVRCGQEEAGAGWRVSDVGGTARCPSSSRFIFHPFVPVTCIFFLLQYPSVPQCTGRTASNVLTSPPLIASENQLDFDVETDVARIDISSWPARRPAARGGGHRDGLITKTVLRCLCAAVRRARSGYCL